jgi:phosphoglycolate phosphatase-like HAD superfamily hydrolase
MPTPTLVWLFDIDGTLLLTQGAGRDALSLALKDQFGIDDDLRSIAFGGRTDLLIVRVRASGIVPRSTCACSWIRPAAAC